MLSPDALTATTTSKLTFEDLLAEEVLSALSSTGYAELHDLEVIVDGHDIILRGHVSSYFLKQKAEFIVRGIPNVGTLKSEIDVA